MATMQREINFGVLGEVLVEIAYEFEPATRDTWDEPGSPASVELTSLTIIDNAKESLKDIEILDLLDPDAYQELEETVLEHAKDEYIASPIRARLYRSMQER